MKTKVVQEIKKRQNKEEDTYAVIGVELRNRRIALSRTLNGVAYKTCSVSYLSKIENNKIHPNRAYVREICTKLDLSDDKIELLLKSKELLITTSVLFYEDKKSKLIDCYNKSIGFTNYRFRLITFIYYVYTKSLYEANALYVELLALVPSMTDFDLYIFGLFSSIFLFYSYEFSEALECLRTLNFEQMPKELRILRNQYIFYCNYAMNRIDTLVEYNRALNSLIKYGEYDKIEYLNYILCIYLIKNKSFTHYDELIQVIKNSKYIQSLSFMNKLFNNEKIKYNDYSDSKLNEFCLNVKRINQNKNDASEFVSGIQSNVYSLDCDYLLIKYYVLTDNNAKIDFILDIAIPTLYKTKELYLIKYFFNELSNLCLISGKYKMFSEAYLRFSNMRII